MKTQYLFYWMHHVNDIALTTNYHQWKLGLIINLISPKIVEFNNKAWNQAIQSRKMVYFIQISSHAMNQSHFLAQAEAIELKKSKSNKNKSSFSKQRVDYRNRNNDLIILSSWTRGGDELDVDSHGFHFDCASTAPEGANWSRFKGGDELESVHMEGTNWNRFTWISLWLNINGTGGTNWWSNGASSFPRIGATVSRRRRSAWVILEKL